MNRFNTPALLLARWTFVGLFVVGVLNSLSAGSRMSASQCSMLLGLTLMASVAAWMQGPRSWRWARVAFLLLSMGVLRLIFGFNHTSWYAVAIWIVAALGMLMARHRLVEPMTSYATTRPRASEQTPMELQAPDYRFDHTVRQARYRFVDLVGMAETKKRLLAAAEDIIAEERASRNGILLFGEPGNGKTLFAEALAGELGLPFFPVTYGDIASKWVNETPQKMEAVFQHARRIGRCVLFLDEFDSFTKAREGSHSMDRDLTNVMLTGIADLHGTQVVLVAATNFIDSVDAAAIREGRFDYRIELPPPDFDARRAILRKTIGEALGYGMVDTRLVSSLAKRWEGFSASRLGSLGGPLSEMRRDGVIGPGRVTFDHGMRAMRMLQGRRGRLPEGVKSIDEIIMPAASRNALRDLAYRLRQCHRLEQIGGSLPTGLIFFGPPGTGKTQAAMSLAKESGYAFLKTTAATVLADPSSWDRLVREAKDIRPAIVFVDEAEGLLADRRYSQAASLTTKILTTLDGANGRTPDVIYIAATNHYDLLDSAIVRGGRFEEKVHFDVPDRRDMELYVIGAVKTISERRYAVKKGVYEAFLRALEGRTIADADALIARALSLAAVRALQENVAEVHAADISLAARSVFAEGTGTTT
jgi:transitional endoplasmic reticulum ATPase